MKNWHFIENKEDWKELTDIVEYTGEYPQKFPCVACPRISTNTNTSIDLAYPLPFQYSNYLYPSQYDGSQKKEKVQEEKKVNEDNSVNFLYYPGE